MSEVVLERKIDMADRFVGKTIAGKYKIDEVWRQSGLGKVYHATHLLMEKPVAIKMLSAEFAGDISLVNRFSAEARIGSGLSHPNILDVTDFGSAPDGNVFIVMEDARGLTVKEMISLSGKFDLDRAVEIARQAALALASAHAAGTVHRNLNSGSVLITHAQDGKEAVKVLDFGSVKLESDAVFEDETALHELEYCAPEQSAGVFEADERSDIYSLGVILYEMLAGEVPFKAESWEEFLEKQTENPPPPLSAFRDDLPDGLEQVVLRALSNNPDMRYQKASALAEDLEEFSIAADRPNIGEKNPNEIAAENVQNNIWKTAFVVLAGISLLAVGLIYATFTKTTEPATILQPDINGSPVQPLNPATGINEQNMIFNPDGTMPEFVGNSSDPMNGMTPGGDGYDAWARGGIPPAGAPAYPAGQVITIPGDGSGSQFMPGLDSTGGIILIPVQVNSNSATTPAPKTDKTPVPANSQETGDAKENPQKTESKPDNSPAKTDKTPTPDKAAKASDQKPAPSEKKP